MVKDASHIQAEFSYGYESILKVTGKEETLCIPLKEWSRLISISKGGSINVSVSVWNDEYPEGIRYDAFDIHVAEDEIDEYLVYRLIEPSYIEFRQLGIYQRNLTDFEETAIVTNRNALTTCINCHSFSSNSPDDILFHVRGANGGTVLYNEGEYRKIDFTKTDAGKNVTYPAWHPDGRFIAFSANTTRQIFYTEGRQQVEVFDTASDLVLYDVQTGKALTDSRFMTEDVLETFPAWSPDGKTLYFASHKAKKLPVMFSPDMQYDLVSVQFDEESGRFGSQVDTLYNSRLQGGSTSYPRISPDGRYLLYTWSEYGTFPIWHNEADLRAIDLATGDEADISVWNTPDQAESYHNWSSNGRWVVFGSRRLDGRFTRLYIGYFDSEGKAHKPFILPQEMPQMNTWRLKSFNVPEFVTGKVEFPENIKPLE
jgi:dipeptidyl aminopeptidase/acylaminoacyl peptidase